MGYKKKRYKNFAIALKYEKFMLYFRKQKKTNKNNIKEKSQYHANKNKKYQNMATGFSGIL